jgi:hypothetical protein
MSSELVFAQGKRDKFKPYALNCRRWYKWGQAYDDELDVTRAIALHIDSNKGEIQYLRRHMNNINRLVRLSWACACILHIGRRTWRF